MNQTNEPVVKPLWLVIDEQGYPIHCGSYKEGCNEHINDAINDYQLEEAVHWKVIEATPIDPNTVTITAAEYEQMKGDAERYRYMRNESSVMLWDAQKWATSHRLDMLVDEAIDQAIANKKAGE